jgi:hypothetical protein
VTIGLLPFRFALSNAKAQRGEAATKTERGPSCPQQRRVAGSPRNVQARWRLQTLLRTGMSALRENLRSARRSWETALQRRRVEARLARTGAFAPLRLCVKPVVP